jgi:hypothetical protein
MANVTWTLNGNAASIEKALQSTSSKYDEVGKKARRAGEESEKGSRVGKKGLEEQASAASNAEKSMGGLQRQIAAAAAGYLAFSTVTKTASAIFRAEMGAMSRAAELTNEQIRAVTGFGRGRTDGALSTDEQMRALIREPAGQALVLPPTERARLASAMQADFGDVSVPQVAEAIMLASMVAGSLNEQSREQFVRNMAIIQKLPTGLNVDQRGNFAMLATQRGVNLADYNQPLERAAALGIEGEAMDRMIALAIGAGTRGESRRVVAEMLNRIEELTAKTERIVEVGGRPMGVVSTGGMTATQAMETIFADPSMMNTQNRAALIASLTAGGTPEAILNRDVMGEAIGGMPDFAQMERRRLRAMAEMETVQSRQGERFAEDQIRGMQVYTQSREMGYPEFMAQSFQWLSGLEQVLIRALTDPAVSQERMGIILDESRRTPPLRVLSAGE